MNDTILENERNLANLRGEIDPKVDSRNTVSHTFTTIASENIKHKLGRIPVGGIIVKQSASANINITSTAKTQITAISDTANVSVTILLI